MVKLLQSAYGGREGEYSGGKIIHNENTKMKVLVYEQCGSGAGGLASPSCQ